MISGAPSLPARNGHGVSPAVQPFQDFAEVSLLGAGKMGKVFLVRGRTDGRQYVVKKVFCLGDKYKANLAAYSLQEARILSRLHHPGIVKMIDFQAKQGAMHLILEHCSGGDLSGMLKTHRQKKAHIPEAVIGKLFHQICSGLAHAHACGVLHRDMKPQNVLISSSGNARIADWGLARIVSESGNSATRVGTLIYMSPEAQAKKPYGFASDVYSVGVMLLEALTLQDMQYSSPGKPDLSKLPKKSLLADMVTECLANDPARRPAAQTLADATLHFCPPPPGMQAHPSAPNAVPATGPQRKNAVDVHAGPKHRHPALDGAEPNMYRRHHAHDDEDDDDGLMHEAVGSGGPDIDDSDTDSSVNGPRNGNIDIDDQEEDDLHMANSAYNYNHTNARTSVHSRSFPQVPAHGHPGQLISSHEGVDGARAEPPSYEVSKKHASSGTARGPMHTHVDMDAPVDGHGLERSHRQPCMLPGCGASIAFGPSGRVEVVSVPRGSIAQLAGLQEGDILMEIGDQVLANGVSPADARSLFARCSAAAASVSPHSNAAPGTMHSGVSMSVLTLDGETRRLSIPSSGARTSAAPSQRQDVLRPSPSASASRSPIRNTREISHYQKQAHVTPAPGPGNVPSAHVQAAKSNPPSLGLHLEKDETGRVFVVHVDPAGLASESLTVGDELVNIAVSGGGSSLLTQPLEQIGLLLREAQSKGAAIEVISPVDPSRSISVVLPLHPRKDARKMLAPHELSEPDYRQQQTVAEESESRAPPYQSPPKMHGIEDDGAVALGAPPIQKSARPCQQQVRVPEAGVVLGADGGDIIVDECLQGIDDGSLRVGDIVVSINGQEMRGRSLDNASKALSVCKEEMVVEAYVLRVESQNNVKRPILVQIPSVEMFMEGEGVEI